MVRADPGLNIPGKFHGFGSSQFGSPGPVPAGVVSCAQLATVPALGRCPAGATAAAFPESGFGFGVNNSLFGMDPTGITWPAANVPASRLDSLAVDAINVATNGSVPAVEQARTMLENARTYPGVSAPSTIGELIRQDNSGNNAYQQLANTVILVSLPIAGCTLAAAIAAGLADRKRPFSLLRLTGARLATLRRVVALESAVPLLAVAAVAVGTGFGAAAEYASVAQHHPMVAPGVAYYLLTAGGILVSLGIIAATFPLLARITGPEVARNNEPASRMKTSPPLSVRRKPGEAAGPAPGRSRPGWAAPRTTPRTPPGRGRRPTGRHGRTRIAGGGRRQRAPAGGERRAGPVGRDRGQHRQTAAAGCWNSPPGREVVGGLASVGAEIERDIAAPAGPG